MKYKEFIFHLLYFNYLHLANESKEKENFFGAYLK